MKPKDINFRLANYHTHTTRCMHAQDAEQAYVIKAIESGFEILGFADHSAWPYKSDFVAGMRMHISELEGYVETVKALREEYKDQIRIHLAMECEAFPEFYGWLRETKEKMGFDYFILGNHYDTTDENVDSYFGECMDLKVAYRYMETTIAGMETGLFAYIAHPDLFLHRYPRVQFEKDKKEIEGIFRAICETAKKQDMPLEYNLLGHKRQEGAQKRGYMGYTTQEFWNIAAEEGNRAIIGVDAHKAMDLDCVDMICEVRGNLKNKGIEVLEVLDKVEGK